MTVQHRALAEGRWFTLSLAQQLGNVGSEVSRARTWQTKDNPEFSHQAFERALELMSLTLDDPKHRGHYKELARTYEVLVDTFATKPIYGGTPESLQRYFDQFAVATTHRT